MLGRAPSRALVARVAFLLGAVSGCASTSVAPVTTGADETPPAECPSLPAPMAFVKSSQAFSLDDSLRVNHVQAKATHNSYHLMPKVTVSEWEYSHVSLAEQLETQGVRGVELDVNWDPECARYRVFHIGILDELTTCAFFTECLVALRGWSAAHPGHHPIFVHLEPKFDASASTNGPRMAALEQEILSVFERPWLLTPDDVKGSSASIADALVTRGWPTLGAARGRFVFYLDDSSSIRDSYTSGRQHLDGRLIFADGDRDEPFVAMQILNDPLAQASAIASALEKNHIVRTRADSSPADAKAGLTAQRDAALASGAQLVSTDFPASVAGVPYSVTIPGGAPSRCAPGVAPPSCTSLAIEDPSLLGR